MEECIRLRAHHGLCLAFFVGKGYDAAFTAHMKEVQKRLSENPQILLLDEADEICSRCPNLTGGVCESKEKTESYDRKTLSLCGLSAGTQTSWREFSELVRENILLPGRRREVCGGCQWEELC